VLGLQESVVVGHGRRLRAGQRATPRSSTCIPRRASATRWASIFTAYKNRTPLVITAASRRARSCRTIRSCIRAGDGASEAYVKWSCEPARAEDVPHAIARAYYLAMQPPRGPVLSRFPPTTGRAVRHVASAMVSTELRAEPARARRDRQALDRPRARVRRRCRRRSRRCVG
jgi:benzoylformate decarboxylase